MTWEGKYRRLDEVRCLIPEDAKKGMRVPGRVYADDAMMKSVLGDNALEQVVNVAFLPGIQGASLGMPDIHWGYGFPIGGVAAVDMDEGVVSPGGIGFDINCGVRLMRTSLNVNDIRPKARELTDEFFRSVPSGVGSEGNLKLSRSDLDSVLREGAGWAVRSGYGWERDIERTEENGRLEMADPACISVKAITRGVPQLGSLGAGNHFIELQRVDKIYEPETASRFGITGEGQVVVMVHTGSRGLGHQVATEAIDTMLSNARNFKVTFKEPASAGETYLPDRQLACAPISSRQGENYLKAMACAANFGWANRQMIMHWLRKSFEKVLGSTSEEMGLELVYDVAHNIAKFEEYEVDGKRRKLLIHRKGATRAFPAGHKDVPQVYRSVGQPVIIPGDMGSASYLLVGTEIAIKESFGTTCHGAGRMMSRSRAMRTFTPQGVKDDLNRKGIYIRAASKEGVVEEAPGVYKNVDNVVDICTRAGLARKVARMVPLAVVKG